MIADPMAFARAIAQAVGVDPAAVEPHLRRWAARVQDSNGPGFVEAVTSRGYSRPDHARRVERWLPLPRLRKDLCTDGQSVR